MLIHGLSEDDVKDFIKRYNCLLFTYGVSGPEEKRGEIGLLGTNREEVELARGWIKDILVSIS